VIVLRVLEYALLAVSSVSGTLSLVLIADAFRDTIYQGAVNGQSVVIARRNLREHSYGFIAQLAFLVVAVSFVTNAVPDPLPPGTFERVSIFTLAAAVILLNSLDAYVTKRQLLAGR
jgi:hypothetical protein